MANLAQLGLRFNTQGAAEAERALDSVTSKSKAAEGAAESLAASQKGVSASFGQLASSAGTVSAKFNEFVTGMMQGVQSELQMSAAAKAAAMAQRDAAHAASVSNAQARGLASVHQFLADALYKARRAYDNFTLGLLEGAAAALSSGVAARTVAKQAQDLARSQAVAAKATKLTGYEVVNLGNQLIDMGVMASYGMKPLHILVSQGTQIAQVFAMARARGLSFGQAMAGLGKTIAPVLPLILGIGAAAGAAFGGAALAARRWNKENGELTDGMGLTKKQLEDLEDAGVKTGITMGDVFRGTASYIMDALNNITNFRDRTTSALDTITKVAVAVVRGTVGAFVMGLAAIKSTWSQLPSVMGDLAVTAANNVIKAIEGMVNRAIAGINKLISMVNGAVKNIPGVPTIGNIGPVSFGGGIDNQWKGAAAKIHEVNKAATAAANKSAQDFLTRVGKGLEAAWKKAGQDRIRDALGRDRSKPARGPHGMTDEREAEMAKMVLDAKRDELQAQLGITDDLRARAQIQKELLRIDFQMRMADLDRQAVNYADQKGISSATKSQLISSLDIVRGLQAHALQLREQLVDRELAKGLAQEGLALEEARTNAQMDLLKAQEGLAGTVEEQQAIQRQISEQELGLERKRLELITKQNGFSEQEVAKAQARLGLLDQIHKAVTERLAREQRRENIEIQEAQQAAQIDLLQAREGAARLEIERYAAARRTQQAEQASEKSRLQNTTSLNGFSAKEVAVAKSRLAVIDDIHEAERRQLAQQIDLLDLFKDAESGLEDFGAAFKKHDWMGAMTALIDTIARVQAALAESGNGAIATLAGLASGLGGLLGGKAGGALSGAASGLGAVLKLSTALKSGGALANLGLGGLGSFLGGPVGMIGGALLGGLGSILGGGESRRERRERQQREAQEKIAGQQEIANQKRDLEIRLIELTGDKVRLLAAQRDKELNSIDAANQELAKQVQAAEDAANRHAQIQDAEIAYLELSEQKMALLNVQREEELKSIDAAIQPLQRMVYAAQDAAEAVSIARDNLQRSYDAEMQTLNENLARAHDNLASAYQRESGKLTDTINTFKQFGDALKDFRRGLEANTEGLSPENAYLRTKAQFADVSSRARMGDQQALTDFQTVAEAFRQASGQYFGLSSTGYETDLSSIKTATEQAAATADRTVTNAERQLDQLKKLVDSELHVIETTMSVEEAVRQVVTAKQAIENTQAIVDPLLNINGNVMKLGDAIAAYQNALNTQAAAFAALAQEIANQKANPSNQLPTAGGVGSTQGYRSTNGDYGAYVRGNPDLLALFQANSGMARGRTIEEFGLYHWANFGQTEGRGVRPYAFGGEFKVGGAGSTDSQRVEMMASPDEHITVRTPQQMSRDAANDDRMATAMEKVADRLDTLITESKADKRQREAVANETRELFKGLGQSFEVFKRRATRS